ncbi:alpha/beta hydrolase [Marinobacter sp. F3R11]|uniref:alpha/beta hydrolase n=1 Tax=Marinobacter sp. F3R11 TaxID=2267231 RepID=UPI000DEAD2FB|nr:alpha/beta hydrolase [Marinobacter sp. F3R11]
MRGDRSSVTRVSIPLYSSESQFGLGGGREPHMEVFLPPPEVATGQSVLALPGGGYSFLSPKSGEQYGHFFASHGIAVAVVHFRLGTEGARGQEMCNDVFAAVRRLQENAARWGLQWDQIGLIGTSAGGHLAAMISTGLAERVIRESHLLGTTEPSWRPAFAVYCYGVLSLNDPIAHRETRENFLGVLSEDLTARHMSSPVEHVSSDHCRAFIWHTSEDIEVSDLNSLEFFWQLRKHSVPVELHLYPKGPHALGLAQDMRSGVRFEWANECVRWIKDAPVLA